MRIGIMQPYFFPYIGYFQLINDVDVYVNLDHVSFMKRSYMTRNTLGAGGVININVSKGSQNRCCNEVRVIFDERHKRKLLGKLSHRYKRSAHYDKVMESIVLPALNSDDMTISQFNFKNIRNVCGLLGIHTKLVDTSSSLVAPQLSKGPALMSKARPSSDEQSKARH